MNMKQLINKVSGGIFALSLLLVIVAMSGKTAQAQFTYGQDQDDRQDRRDDRRSDRDRDHDRDRPDRDQDRDRDRNRDRYDGNYNNGYYGNDPYRVAQEQGRRDGYAQGESDAQYGRPYNPRGGRMFINGTSGYNSSYGKKNDYKRAYQDSFVNGYDQGFQRNNNNGYRRGRRDDRRYP